MFHALTVDTWTIYSTLYTGFTLGVLTILTCVGLIIRQEIKLNKANGEAPQLTAGLTVIRTQDQVYDHSQNKHIA